MKKLSILAVLMTVTVILAEYYTPITLTMRDSKVLAADVYALDTTIAKPVILIQTPYNKNTYRTASVWLDPADTMTFWDMQHYNFVTVDWRGFFASSDADSTGYDRGRDGYDCIEEIATRTFCNGRIGTYGGSALGDIQFRTAKEHPPHLVCAAPWIMDQRTDYADYYYGGVLKEQHLRWHSYHFGLSIDLITAHPTCCTPTWNYLYNTTNWVDEYEVPMFMVTGWFDHRPAQIIRDFKDMREASHPSVREQHKLMVGPWLHNGIDQPIQGELTYAEAAGRAEDMVMLFFDHYLRDAANNYEALPVAQFYIMPDSIWLETDDWSSVIPDNDTLFLHADASLQTAPPTSDSPYTEFEYDPHNPTPSYGGELFDPLTPDLKIGPCDIRDSVESRDDVLIFTTPPLTHPITVLGSGSVVLYIFTDRTDTDFAFRLTDVYPDGRSMIMTQGIRRGRLAQTLAEENLLTPGEVVEVEIPIRPLAMKWKTGHSLRLVISSSNWPHFNRNLNNGGPMYEPGDTLIATNRIYHTLDHPSMLILPIAESTEMVTDSPGLPTQNHLTPYPNPFNATCILPPTTTGYIITDIRGRTIATTNSNTWTPTQNTPSGLYFATSSSTKTPHRLLHLK